MSTFTEPHLFRMAKLYEQFPSIEIVTTVSAQLSWSHFVEIIKLNDAIKREFYLNMAAEGRWSVRTLRERMDGMLYERMAIAKQPDALIQRELVEMATRRWARLELRRDGGMMNKRLKAEFAVQLHEEAKLNAAIAKSLEG